MPGIPKEFIPHILELGKHVIRTMAENRAAANTGTDGRLAAVEQNTRVLEESIARMGHAIDANFRETGQKFQELGAAVTNLRNEDETRFSTLQRNIQTATDDARIAVERASTQASSLRTFLFALAIWNVLLTIAVIVLLVRR